MMRMLEIIKWACIALVFALVIGRTVTGQPSKADFADVKQAVLASLEQDNLEEGDMQMFRRFYDLDPSVYQEIVYYYPASNMAAEELLLVRLQDHTQEEALLSAIQARLDAQIKNFEGYGVEQTAMLENAVVKAKGNYVLFVSAKDPDAAAKAFLDAL